MAVPPSSSGQYDVFICFRGKDTRNNFTSHLQASLHRRGIDAFVDNKLSRGNDISALLFRIERSRIAIIIFSRNFANSEWCLQELVKILECRQKKQLVVVPIFYKVRKSDVENQTGSFAAPFERPEEVFPPEMHQKVAEWKAALAKASNIAGHVVTEESSEADVVDKIAKETFKMLNDLTPSEAEDLVGIEPRLMRLEKLLSCNELGSVRVIGVIGMGGIGKTTIADCLYKRMRGQFDGSCFLANIRENSQRYGLDHLLSELLCRLLNAENLELGALDTAHEALKDRLRNKRLLIVLDDVNNEKQIRYLMGQRKWFREGSRIIITTRDRKLINMVVDETFVVPKLNYRESLQLFSMNAFNNNFCPLKDFMSMSNMFLDYTKGHPLALKLLGSDLCERDKAYWEGKLNRLKSRSDGQIQEVLQISYEELSIEQKNIFLDIACFFRSENVDYVTSLLNSHGVDASSVIRDLVDKCLITISDNRLDMHELLHTMGKEISLRACTKETGYGSRLWDDEDICHMLKYKTGTSEIRGIFLDTSKVGKIRLGSKAFKGMWNLRYLKIYDSHCSRGCGAGCKFHFPEGLSLLPDKLTYLHWQGYPLPNLPLNFNPKNLIDLKLLYGQIEQLWDDDKETGKLKWVDLSHSSNLHNISGLSKAQNLERLILEGCTSLKRLPSSMDCMEKLVYLNLRECTRLKSLPKEINLKSLQTLILSGCSSLKKFPQISENVEVLLLDGTAIKSLPESIVTFKKLALLNLKNCSKLKQLPNDLCKLKSLQELILSGCSELKSFSETEEDMESLEILLLDETAIKEMPKITHFSNIKKFSFCRSNSEVSMGLLLPPLSGCSRLTDLYLTGCNLYKLPDDVSGLSSLQSLFLSRNNIENLPESIKELHHLKWFDIKYCKNLKRLPVLPPNLQYLDAHECESLETAASPLTLPMVADCIHSTFIFSNCFNLNRDAQDNVVRHAQIKSQLMAKASVEHHHRGLILEPLIGICFPGTETPVWLCHQRIGYSLETQLPPHWCDARFVGFALCAVVSFKDYFDITNHLSVKCSCEIENEGGSSIRFNCTIVDCYEPYRSPDYGSWRLASDHVFLGYNNCFHVKKCQGENNKLTSCCPAKASFKFFVTDDTEKKLEPCEVVKCGMSLLYAPDDDDSRILKKTSSVQLTSNTESSCSTQAWDKAVPKRDRCKLSDEEKQNGKRIKEEIPLSY